ncbi:MAG: hypothetical protein DI534_06215 [Leifsonia xyli]|nr:MAG: hypothetical protein DI534_06215 [Leifsonia xyli]
MNEPQVWTLIGVFTAMMLGGLTLSTTLTMRAFSSSIDGLRGEMSSLRGEMSGRFESAAGEMNARFDTVESKIGHLDRDVAALTRKVWGEPGG